MSQEIVAANLAVVNAHFHSEAANEIEKALSLYTDDIIWESPMRRLVFHGKQETAENYQRMFGSMADVKVTPLRRFATADRVVDDSLMTFRLVDDGVVNAPLPVGSEVDLRLVHIFEMHDRSIAREIVYEMWRAAMAGGTAAPLALGGHEGRKAKVAELRTKSDFGAMIAHDLKAPLAIISGYADLLSDSPLTFAEVKNLATRIGVSVHRALTLAVNFLDASRIREGRLVLHRRPTDLVRLLRHVVMHQRTLAEAKGIRIVEANEGDFPLVDADEAELDRVFANLLNNAIHHTPPSGTVRISMRRMGARALEVVVEDGGEGIPPERLGLLFEKFSAPSDLPDSTGLGLFIVKTITEAHGGLVIAENRSDGPGACFRVQLPVGTGEEETPLLKSGQERHCGESTTRMAERSIIIFQDSFSRCMASSAFFDIFYNHFLGSSPEVAEKFRNTDFAKQKRALKKSLYYIMDAVVRRIADYSELERIALRHSRSQANIPAHLYTLWLDSLLFAVKECDPRFNAEIEATWRDAMQPGIDCMIWLY